MPEPVVTPCGALEAGSLAVGLVCQTALDRAVQHFLLQQGRYGLVDITGAHRLFGCLQNASDGLHDDAGAHPLIDAARGPRAGMAGGDLIQFVRQPS